MTTTNTADLPAYNGAGQPIPLQPDTVARIQAGLARFATPAGKVAVTLTDTSTGQTHTLYVDPTADGLIVLDVNGYDLAGVDLAAGTVGAWRGDQADPHNREWQVVDRFTLPIDDQRSNESGQAVTR